MRWLLGIAAVAGCSSLPMLPELPMSAAALGIAEPAPPSRCPGYRTCERACDSGDSAACTRLGDITHGASEASTRALYRRGCDGGDPIGCARLAELAGEDRVTGDRFLRRACGLGHPGSCELLAEAAVVAFMAPRPGEDTAALRELARRSAERGCALGSYRSCVRSLAFMRADLRPAAAIARTAVRGMELAEAACARRELGACGLVAAWASAVDDTDRATRYVVEQCAIERHVAGRGSPPPALAEIGSCLDASALAGGVERLRSRLAGVRVAPANHRLVSESELLERLRRRYAMRSPDQPGESAHSTGLRAELAVCASPRGGVAALAMARFSSLPRWNRRLFEWFRAARFRPLRRGDGEPIAACARVTLVVRSAWWPI